MIDKDKVVPPQWSDYLKNVWLKDDRKGYISRIASIRESAEWNRGMSEMFLENNSFEFHLEYKQKAEEDEYEADYMEKLLV